MRKEENVYLGAYWKNRQIVAREFIKLCYEFMTRLRRFSSAFDHQCVAVGDLPNVEPLLVPKDYFSFEKLMLRAVPNSKRIYTNPDATNRGFTLDSTYVSGFSIAFSDLGQKGIPATNLGSYVSAGRDDAKFSRPNSVLIEIPAEYRQFWDNTQRAKELLELVVSTWKPAFATLTSSELEQALNPHKGVLPCPGRLAYFADERVGPAANSTANVEYASKGGVFLDIDAPYPWAASVDRFKPCYARLSNAGLLQWPT